TTSRSKCPSDPKLDDRRRIELLVCKRSVDGKLQLRLHVDTIAHLYGESRRDVHPVAAAFEHRRAVKYVLPAMEPFGAAEAAQSMCAEFARKPAVQFCCGASSQTVAVFKVGRARRHAAEQSAGLESPTDTR